MRPANGPASLVANAGRPNPVVWARRHFGILCAVAVFVYCAIHVSDPPRLNWGDSESDYGVMTAGRNFHDYGFLRLHLTPYLLDPATMRAADRPFIYTHYPQLPDLMNGAERAVGLSQVAQFRLVSLCLSFGALVFVYLLVAAYWSRLAAECSLALWAVNPLWIQHADNLHQVPYAHFFGAGSVYFLDRFLRAGDDAKRRDAWLSGLFLFLTFLSSYNFWFFVPLMLAAVTFAHRGASRPALRILAGLAACAVAAIAFKWATNAWALGGVHDWLADLRYQVTERSTGDAVRTAYTGGIAPTAVGRVEHYFSLLFFGVMLFWIAAPATRRAYERRGFAVPRANPLVILAAALPFLCLFTELWVEQVSPTLLLLSFYAVASGALVALLLQARSRAAVAVGLALFAALTWNSLDEDLRFEKAFFDPRAIASLRHELDSVSAPGQRILVNHVFDGAYRYYFNRSTVALIATPMSHIGPTLDYYTDSASSLAATPTGAVFVQHKHVASEMFDKGYYYVIARYGRWQVWANPGQYRPVAEWLVTDTDRRLAAAVATRGRKLYETPYYTLWHLDPAPAPSSGAAPNDEAHLAKVEGQRERTAP